MLRISVGLLVGVFSAGPVLAQQSDEALEHYARGREHYQAGQYEEARVELERALELDADSAVLVYNLGRVYEGLGDFDRAADYYEQFLERSRPLPRAERERVQRTIERLRGASGRDAGDRPGGRADPLFWSMLGGGGAVLITGAVAGVFALVRESAADDFVLGVNGSVADRNAAHARSRRLALTADVMIPVGAAAMTTALLLFLLRGGERSLTEQPLALTLTAGSGHVGLVVGGNL